MLTGQNGILNNATRAKQDTERQQIIETARVDILAKQTENQGSLSEEELVEILTSPDYNTKGTLSENNEESVQQKTLTSSDGKYEILVSDIYNGKLSTETNDTTIEFYIDTDTFTATKGMKFRQWIEKNHPKRNDHFWEVYTGFSFGSTISCGSSHEFSIVYSDAEHEYGYVSPDDTIIDGYKYSVVVD